MLLRVDQCSNLYLWLLEELSTKFLDGLQCKPFIFFYWLVPKRAQRFLWIPKNAFKIPEVFKLALSPLRSSRIFRDFPLKPLKRFSFPRPCPVPKSFVNLSTSPLHPHGDGETPGISRNPSPPPSPEDPL